MVVKYYKIQMEIGFILGLEFSGKAIAQKLKNWDCLF